MPSDRAPDALVTGIGHPVARALVAHLGERPRRLYVVARPEERDAAGEAAASASAAEVVVLEGDPGAMDMGLSGPEVREVVGRIDRIHHVAHASDPAAGAAGLEHDNVDAAREAVELLRAAGGRARLVFHSSVFVAPTEGGVAYEADARCDDATHDPVTETRRRAEALVRRAGRTVPVIVVRTGGVVAPAHTGTRSRASLRDPHLAPLWLSLASEGHELSGPLAALARSLGSAPIHLAPVEFVVRAIDAIAEDDRAVGRIHHVVDPSPRCARDVARHVGEALGSSRRRAVGLGLVSSPLLAGLLRSPRAFVERLATRVRLDTLHADQALAPSQVRCPPIETYVDRLADAILADAPLHAPLLAADPRATPAPHDDAR